MLGLSVSKEGEFDGEDSDFVTTPFLIIAWVSFHLVYTVGVVSLRPMTTAKTNSHCCLNCARCPWQQREQYRTLIQQEETHLSAISDSILVDYDPTLPHLPSGYFDSHQALNSKAPLRQ